MPEDIYADSKSVGKIREVRPRGELHFAAIAHCFVKISAA